MQVVVNGCLEVTLLLTIVDRRRETPGGQDLACCAIRTASKTDLEASNEGWFQRNLVFLHAGSITAGHCLGLGSFPATAVQAPLAPVANTLLSRNFLPKS